MLALFLRRSRVIEPADKGMLSQAPKEGRRSAAMQSTDIDKPVGSCTVLLAFSTHWLPPGSTARRVRQERRSLTSGSRSPAQLFVFTGQPPVLRDQLVHLSVVPIPGSTLVAGGSHAW